MFLLRRRPSLLLVSAALVGAADLVGGLVLFGREPFTASILLASALLASAFVVTETT
jgi:hypothetical protein